MILKTIKEIEDYIENLRMETYLKRIETERLDVLEGAHRYPKSAELSLSNYYSYTLKLEEGLFDDRMVDLKEKTLFKLIEKYPNGIEINNIGGCFPILS